MAKFDYDVLVIGGGSGGLTASKMAAGLGKKVGLIERDKLGGECTWSGCVPSKALIKAAELVHSAKKLKELRFIDPEKQKLNSAEIMHFVRDRVKEVYQTHTPEVIAKEGIDVLFGSPQFLDNHSVVFAGKTVSAKKFIICTGSSPFIPPIEGLADTAFLTNKSLFDLEKLPESLLILGAGPIGSEIACALNRLGVQVTVVEMNKQIMPREDMQLAVILQEHLAKEGVLFKTETRATQINALPGSAEFICTPASELSQIGQQEEATFKLRAERCLIATGRKPNTEGLDLEKAGVQFDKRGIVVNKRLKTTAPNIYACGDVIGSYQFSHVAWQQAIVATRNALIPLFKQRIDYKNVLWITFTAPELASLGLTEQQAQEQYGSQIKIYKKRYSEIDRGVIDMATPGLGKFICDKKGRLLGAHILGARAGELIHELQLTKALGAKFSCLGSVLHAYPAYSDLVWKAAKKARLDALQNNFFVKLYKKLFGKGKK